MPDTDFNTWFPTSQHGVRALYRPVTETKTSDYTVTFADSGKVFNNAGATAPVTFKLPNLSDYGWVDVQSTHFTFVVMGIASQPLTIEVDASTWSATFGPSPRIGWATVAGTNGVSSSVFSDMTIASIDIWLADGAADPTHTIVPYRWFVRNEYGLWTKAGTPAGMMAAGSQHRARNLRSRGELINA